MFPPLRNWFVIFGLVLLLATLAASQQTPPPPAAVDQEQIVPYWTTETGWKSELQLRNNQVGHDLTVTPVLRLADGAETALAPVTIKSEEVTSIDIEAAIGATAPQLVGTYGSLLLRYRTPDSRSLYASLMVRNVGHPFAFHIDATIEVQDLQAGSREGIWWLPKDTTKDYLVLTNQGKITLPLDLSLYDAYGKESKQKVLLGPHETNRYSVRNLILAAGLSGSYGGIKVSAASHAGSLDSVHFLFDESAAFSAVLKMFDHDPNAKLEERDFAKTAVWTLRAPMLALSNPDPALAFPPGTSLRPQLFIRNNTSKLVDAALRFNWRAGSTSGKAAGPAFRLNPNETRRIDVAALQSSGLLPKQANWTSVTLTTNGPPDEVMAVAASFDDTLRYGAQTPFNDQLSFLWKGGMWEYDAYHSSIITAGNGGTKPTRAAFTLFYNQGTEKYELEQTLQPDEQMWIDVGKLIREHLPDKNGKTLPADLTSGSYEFRDLTDIAIGSLFEGKVIYDKTYGHVTYGCGFCCPYQAPFLAYDPLGIALAGDSQNGVTAYETCSGTYVDVSDYFFNSWSTANAAIATVNGSAVHHGVGVGSTTSQTHAYMAYGYNRPCPLAYRSPSGGANVHPTVSLNTNTPFAFIGSDPTIPQPLIQAIGKPANGTYSWTASPANRVSFNNPNTDIVHVKGINPSSSLNDTTLTANYSVGGQSAAPASRAITVRVFELLNQTAPVSIDPKPNGFFAFVTYNVLTGPGKQLLQPGFSGISVGETVTTTSATLNGVALTPQQLSSITLYKGQGATTDTNSNVGDDQSLLNNTGNPLPTVLVINLSQEFFVGGFYVRTNGIQKTSNPSVTIANNGPVIP
jgi:hypothetical protein